MIATFVLILAFSGATDAQETTLEKLILQASGVDQDSNRSSEFNRLECDWIGDVTSTDGEVTKIRLEYGAIMDGKVHLARMFNNRFVASDAPIYIDKLPKGKELESLKTVEELEAHFGQSQGFTSGFGFANRMHWTVGWTFVTRIDASQLRYLSVFARVSKAGLLKSDSPSEVDKLQFTEGILRPADPQSLAERIEYPTGEALFAAQERKKNQERERYPLPLRNLVKAREHPDDSDLIHYRKYLNEVRTSPDPLLFKQLLAVIDEGTLARRSDLEAIVVDSWHELEPWTPENRKKALRMCIEGIPLVKDSAKSDLMVILLKANGGGTIDVGNRRIEVTIRGDGFSATHDSTPASVSLEETQRQLLKMLIKE